LHRLQQEPQRRHHLLALLEGGTRYGALGHISLLVWPEVPGFLWPRSQSLFLCSVPDLVFLERPGLSVSPACSFLRGAPGGLPELPGEDRGWQAESHLEIPALFPSPEEVLRAGDEEEGGGDVQLQVQRGRWAWLLAPRARRAARSGPGPEGVSSETCASFHSRARASFLPLLPHFTLCLTLPCRRIA